MTFFCPIPWSTRDGAVSGDTVRGVDSTVSPPDTLIALNYFIAVGYAVASISLVYASVIGYRHLTGGSRMNDTQPLIAVVLSFLWVGAALFLLGCGWHHVQHAHHLRYHPMASDTNGVAYAAAWLQAIGEIIAIGSASMLISVLNRHPVRRASS